MGSPSDASIELAALHPVVAELVERYGPCQLGTKPTTSQRFETLAKAIVSQQLAGAAADTIWGRLRASIGPWTADMFMIFALRRLDVWPTGDLGVRVGFGRAFSLPETPTAMQLAPLGDPFRPYRSVLAWYCWRAVGPRAQAVPKLNETG